MRASALCVRAEKVRRKKPDLTVDDIVAATAVERVPSVVITGDSSLARIKGPDLELLVDGFDAKVSAL
jgi:hypothetical protein